MTGRIHTVQLENLAAVLGVTSITPDWVESEALATRRTDAVPLYRIARSLSPATILEVGTFFGHTTVGLAVNCPESKVYTVDISLKMGIPVPASQRVELLPRELVGQRFRNGPDRIIQVFGDSRDAATWAKIPRVDFSYIDGNHTFDAILDDSRNVLAHSNSGGAIVWHDFKDDVSVDTICALGEFAKETGRDIYHVAKTWIAVMAT